MLKARLLSLGLGLPLLLGSTPAAAAGAGASLLGGVTTWIGVVAALWALLGPPQAAGGVLGTTALAVLAALMLVSMVWGRRQQRHRSGSVRSRSTAPERPARAFAASCPAALDGAQVLDAARARFLGLQAAWDAGDVPALRHLTTPDMLAELLPVLTGRGTAPNRTDVISLHAELIGVEEMSAAYLASVEFSGLICESAEQGAVPFRELWMLSSSKDGSPSWRLARQQALF